MLTDNSWDDKTVAHLTFESLLFFLRLNDNVVARKVNTGSNVGLQWLLYGWIGHNEIFSPTQFNDYYTYCGSQCPLSLMSSPCAPPEEKHSRSNFFGLLPRNNEIASWLIITYHFPYSSKILPLYSGSKHLQQGQRNRSGRPSDRRINIFTNLDRPNSRHLDSWGQAHAWPQLGVL